MQAPPVAVERSAPEARAALSESERRIRSIAIVHETLSREP